jgi:KDO2-lipid IV(A) lauroyltransferase
MTVSVREIRQRAEYVAVRGALAMAGALPMGIARAIGAGTGTLAWVLGVRRRVCLDNITRALGVNRAQASRIARRSYQNLGRSLMEFAAFRRWSGADVLARVDIDGMDHLVRAREAGRGVLLVAGHYGNWEMLGAAIGHHGHPISFVVGQQTNHRVDDVMNDLRRAQGIGIIPRGTALRKVLQALRANQAVALLADQDARKGGVMVDFLGRPASTVRGPALFALRAGCPILPVFIRRDGGRHRATVEPPLWPDPARDEDAAVLDLTQRYTDALARQVRAHPDQYFWPHRRWKTQMSN